jgi:hypothetical protein
MQQTPRRRRQNQTTHATDNVQQTADDMQEDASTCEMQQETHSTAAFRVRRAAGSAQPAACAKHCTRQPVRNTADATQKMQHTTGAAACSNHTRNRHHAGGIETYEMRRTESGRSSHLQAAPGFQRSGLITARKDSEPPKMPPTYVAARRLPISLACVHRWPTDVDRPKCGIRTRLGAREVHARMHARWPTRFRSDHACSMRVASASAARCTACGCTGRTQVFRREHA